MTSLVQLDQIIATGTERGWLEWNGMRMFLAASPSGIEPPPPSPTIPPEIIDPVEPTPEDPDPTQPPPTVPINATTETVYTNPGIYTYIVPAGVDKLDYVLSAAGGAGGTGYRLNWCAGGGGQAGEVKIGSIKVKAGDVVTVEIGTGGAPRGSAGSSGNPGGRSTLSVNGMVIVAAGGLGGSPGKAGTIGGADYRFYDAGTGTQTSVEVLGGGNIAGGWGNLTTTADRYGVYSGGAGSKPHKTGGKGGTNGIGAGGEGGPWSWSGPGAEVSAGRSGQWPGGGGGGGGSDEGDGIAAGGYGANGGAYLFTGQGFVKRFPSGLVERTALERAGANTKAVYGYTQKASSDSCCVAPHTKIHTPEGDICIVDLRPGMYAYSYDTEQQAILPNRILEVSLHMRSSIYDVEFVDGRVLSITDDHPMLAELGWQSIDPQKTAASYDLHVEQFDADSLLVDVGRSNEIVSINERVGTFETYTLTMTGEENTRSFIAEYVVVHNRRCGGDA